MPARPGDVREGGVGIDTRRNVSHDPHLLFFRTRLLDLPREPREQILLLGRVPAAPAGGVLCRKHDVIDNDQTRRPHRSGKQDAVASIG